MVLLAMSFFRNIDGRGLMILTQQIIERMKCALALVVLVVGLSCTSARMTGRLDDVHYLSPNLPRVKEVAEKSMEQMGTAITGGRTRVIKKVQSAKYQSVLGEGIKYFLKVQIELYDCSEAELNAKAKHCVVKKRGTCDFVTLMPFMSLSFNLLSSHCTGF
ncbi:hypothetical protein HELRODRAFT_162538 [Helobdella robusta]|uniref:Cystatin domain-containing protein n=1 Tax=Helobdella robusta TaxID=6412 RepID=T1EST4_HELRO|nr:hypothetical protein HELRODRAFT_162538 [Helobdella robusta]ESN99057.1 hypothetical protein HELRODRAFT_162538 [Helobdella robusta]